MFGVTFNKCLPDNPYYSSENSGYVSYGYSFNTGFVAQSVTDIKCSGKYLLDGNSIYNRGQQIIGADLPSFSIMNNEFSRDKFSAYFMSKRIPLGDPKSFKVSIQNSYYSQDSMGFYYGSDPVFPADPSTFKVIGKYFAVDSVHIYSGNLVLDSVNNLVDRSTFAYIGGPYYRDANYVYVVVNENDFNASPLSLNQFSSNPGTFEYISGNFAKNNVSYFYGNSTMNGALPTDTINVLDENYSIVSGNVYYNSAVVTGADPASFKPLKYGYGVDNTNLYLRGMLIGATDTSKVVVGINANVITPDFACGLYGKLPLDPATTKYLGGNYFKDSTAVIYSKSPTNTVISNDAANFEMVGIVLDTGKPYAFYAPKAKDSINVYQEGSIDSRFNPASYKLLSPVYQLDGTAVYWTTYVVSGADPSNFVALNENYAKDTANVYFHNQTVTGADPGTIKVLGVNYVKDATTVYSGPTVVNSGMVDIPSFRVVSEQYSKDVNNVYYSNLVVNGANPATFKVFFRFLNSNSLDTWAGDADHVIHKQYTVSNSPADLNTIRLAGANLYVVVYDNNMVYTTYASSPNVGFKYLSSAYTVNNGVVYQGEPTGINAIAGADGANFSLLSATVGRDLVNVYNNKTLLSGLAATQTQYVAGYLFDTDTFYYGSTLVPGVDIPSLTFYSKQYQTYYRDNNNVYFRGFAIAGVDLATFVVDSVVFNYAHDTNFSYVNGVAQ